MKSLFEQMGGTYHEENGYLIPNLILPDEEQVEIGVWGQRHLRFIKQYHKVRYTRQRATITQSFLCYSLCTLLLNFE